MTWTYSATNYWAITAVPIKPAATGPDRVLTMNAVDPSGGGTTTPAEGVHTYAEGTVVTISATPSAGYVFDHWTGAVANASSASTTVTMDADKTVTAHFVVTHDLTMVVVRPAAAPPRPPRACTPTPRGRSSTSRRRPIAGYAFESLDRRCGGSQLRLDDRHHGRGQDGHGQLRR